MARRAASDLRARVSAKDETTPSATSKAGQREAWADVKWFKWRVVAIATAIKLFLTPAYRSTDFEVHRNWLAVTYSLPLGEWYTNTASEWTLDYPPLFAWFEWSLAQVAQFVDPAMLQVQNHKYASLSTVLFQRGSVILADFVLVSGAWFATRRLNLRHSNVVFFLIVAHPGLLIVDHIHFQYNGFLLGILLWSLGMALEGYDLASGILFAILVNMKHLFATLGPVYAVYLLRHYCSGEAGILGFLQLGIGVSAVCAASFGPFVEKGQLAQVLQRLFPFGRGLCHAYWAANVWALYATLDKALAFMFRNLGIPFEQRPANLTGGLVGAAKFSILPDIPPAVSVLMILFALLPVLVTLWRKPNPVVLLKAVTYAALTSFMLGYHVHEKAALTAIIPAALGSIASRRAAGEFLFLSTVSTYALFPLLYQPTEYPVKVLLLVTYTLIGYILLSESVKGTNGAPERMLNTYEGLYLSGLGLVEVYGTWVHPYLLPQLAFLPLMLVSIYCAAGMVYIWTQPDVIEIQVVKQY